MTDSERDLRISPSDEPVPGEKTYLKLVKGLGCDPDTREPQALQSVTIHSRGGVSTLAGGATATSADMADVTTQRDFRAMILATAGVQDRVASLAAARADVTALCAGAESLSRDLQGVVTPREIEHASSLLQRSVPPVPSLVGHTGSGRERPHPRTLGTLQLVAESLGLHAAGMSLTEADEAVAERAGVEGARRTTEEITQYRCRVVRDAARLRPE